MYINLHLVRVEIPGKYKKLKTNEANISQVLKTTVCVLCYRLRHMLSQAKYSQYTQGLIEKIIWVLVMLIHLLRDIF